MQDLDEELWKLGIPAKTKHNEVAPAQHELAPIFSTTNIAVDHNQLTMEIMKKVAEKHNLVCLLHEKPFEGINGSGKHNNWSLTTNTGENLLDLGKTKEKNTRFLVFLAAIIEAIDNYADLMRMSAASAGNDHRLGANEAPPAIVSMFLGDEISNIVKAVLNDEYFNKPALIQMETGAHVLPHFTKDSTDRNRTSPFAFTGNKFEFRMLGSSASVAGPNVVLNTAVAESLSKFAEKLADVPADELDSTVHSLIKDTISAHQRIIFDGNNYSDEWVEEAEKRGLFNLRSTPEAVKEFISEKNIALFTKHQILTKEEIFSRYEIHLENYAKTIHIEAKTMFQIMSRDFLPSMLSYMSAVSEEICRKKTVLPGISTACEEKLLKDLTGYYEAITADTAALDDVTKTAESMSDVLEQGMYYHNTVLSLMDTLRASADAAELLIPDEYLSYPTYDKLLFSV
ncbi:MAG: glutamine synthetase [Candidatus Fimimorpha sp.]